MTLGFIVLELPSLIPLYSLLWVSEDLVLDQVLELMQPQQLIGKDEKTQVTWKGMTKIARGKAEIGGGWSFDVFWSGFAFFFPLSLPTLYCLIVFRKMAEDILIFWKTNVDQQAMLSTRQRKVSLAPVSPWLHRWAPSASSTRMQSWNLHQLPLLSPFRKLREHRASYCCWRVCRV